MNKTLIDKTIANAIRGGCPELFTYPYSDFPELVVENIWIALNKMGCTIVSLNR